MKNFISEQVAQINELSNSFSMLESIANDFGQGHVRKPLLCVSYYVNYEKKYYEIPISDKETQEAFVDFIRRQMKKAENKLESFFA